MMIVWVFFIYSFSDLRLGDTSKGQIFIWDTISCNWKFFLSEFHLPEFWKYPNFRYLWSLNGHLDMSCIARRVRLVVFNAYSTSKLPNFVKVPICSLKFILAPVFKKCCTPTTLLSIFLSARKVVQDFLEFATAFTSSWQPYLSATVIT